MSKSDPKPVTLDQWLDYIEALHPKSIAMGLDRVREVATRLRLNPSFPIITVAGTNGKGSTCAMLEAVYVKAGYRVGCYTSPHLIRYNERVRINQGEVSDVALCEAFSAVEAARGEIALTYFEIGTLAAVWHFASVGLDVAILEVGMGGRLDAVNVFEPACAIVTSVDLDHIEYLGDTREKIGAEKAGIYRTNKLAICGDDNPPRSVVDYAAEIRANFQLFNRDFEIKKLANGCEFTAKGVNIRLPELALQGDFQLNNAACVIYAVLNLNEVLPVPLASIAEAIKDVRLAGRFNQISVSPVVIADVAHNPQAAKSLAHNLRDADCSGNTLAVFAMLADKDIEGVIKELLPYISVWYLGDIHNVRGAKAQDLAFRLNKQSAIFKPYDTVVLALHAAIKDASKNDRIIVFGSFYTVAEAMASLNLKV